MAEASKLLKGPTGRLGSFKAIYLSATGDCGGSVVGNGCNKFRLRSYHKFERLDGALERLEIG